MVKKLVRCQSCERLYRKSLRKVTDDFEICPECMKKDRERIERMERTFDEPLHRAGQEGIC